MVHSLGTWRQSHSQDTQSDSPSPRLVGRRLEASLRRHSTSSELPNEQRSHSHRQHTPDLRLRTRLLFFVPAAFHGRHALAYGCLCALAPSCRAWKQACMDVCPHTFFTDCSMRPCRVGLSLSCRLFRPGPDCSTCLTRAAFPGNQHPSIFGNQLRLNLYYARPLAILDAHELGSRASTHDSRLACN
jgi:hypothetical protein